MYLVPNLTLFSGSHNFSTYTNFVTIDGLDLNRTLFTPIMVILLLHSTWSGPTVSAWFGHLIFSTLQFKVTYVLFSFLLTYIVLLLSTMHFSSTNSYDYVIVLINFFTWIWLMFFSNNLFTFVFFLEILSASITLLLVTSTFSSFYFYNNSSFSQHSYFHTSTPSAYLQTLLFFFWITLVTSLMLFLLVLYYYFNFLTFDWNLTESVFLFVTFTSSIKSTFSLSSVWLLMLVCVFLKCGIVPFYLWKPSFFKGMNLISLFFYIYVYYFAIFFYFVYVMFFYLNEIFFANVYLLTGLVIISTVVLVSILFESFYIKAFLALSSILNSTLVLYALCSYNSTDLLFLL